MRGHVCVRSDLLYVVCVHLYLLGLVSCKEWPIWRKQQPSIFEYSLNQSVILQVAQYRYLGVTLTTIQHGRLI